MILDVGVALAGATADEAAGLEVIGRPQAVLAQHPAQADQRLAVGRHLRIQRDRLGAGDLKVEFQVVLQILTHSGELPNDADAVAGQFRPGTDA